MTTNPNKAIEILNNVKDGLRHKIKQKESEIKNLAFEISKINDELTVLDNAISAIDASII